LILPRGMLYYRLQTMDNSLVSLIGSAASVAIVLPDKPTFDQVASGLALNLSFVGKKEATISCSAPMVVEFNRLVGVDKISSESGSKNLILKFKDYQATDIERVSYDIENGEFKLTIVPKAGFPSPTQDQIEFSKAGIGSDMVILMGGNSEVDFGALASGKLAGVKILHFGIKVLDAASDKNIMSFARPASSLSELVAQIIGECNLTMDGDIATNLIAGIEEGSNSFQGGDVTADTFQIVAGLMRAGGQRTAKTVLQTNFPAGSIPGQVPAEVKKAPADWLEPKIYKGTSVS